MKKRERTIMLQALFESYKCNRELATDLRCAALDQGHMVQTIECLREELEESTKELCITENILLEVHSCSGAHTTLYHNTLEKLNSWRRGHRERTRESK